MEGTILFTSTKADKEMVINLYTAGFVEAFDSYPRVSQGHNIVSFSGLDFGRTLQEAETGLAGALAYVARHCTFPHGQVRVDATGNSFSVKAKAALRQAVRGCPGIEALYL